jgi:dephospho-CoA kinase
MYVVGLTGGIGSGKSAASDHFKQLGITIVDADYAAREVVKPGTSALQKIEQHFGDEIIQSNGKLDRGRLRQRIFASPDEKQWLETLLHPLIRTQMEMALQQAQSPYVILSAPLLIEGGLYQRCDRVLVVDIPETLQITRTANRDSNSEEQIKKIIGSQISRKERLQKADEILDNSGSLAELQQQVETLHTTYLNYAREKADKN